MWWQEIINKKPFQSNFSKLCMGSMNLTCIKVQAFQHMHFSYVPIVCIIIIPTLL